MYIATTVRHVLRINTDVGTSISVYCEVFVGRSFPLLNKQKKCIHEEVS